MKIDEKDIIKTRNAFLYGNEAEKCIFHENNKYTVPLYQREYSWGEEEINKFIKYLFEGMRSHPNKPYFMGTLQFNICGDIREIVDGQQRIVTLLLLIKYLQKKQEMKEELSDFTKFIKTIEINNSKGAKTLLQTADYEKTARNRSYPKSKFEEALLYINNSIQEFCESEDQTFNASEVLEYVKHIYFVVIETKQKSLSEIVSIFNTINTTGMDLGTKDIFKVQYFSYLRGIENKEGSTEKDEEIMKNINSLYQKVEEFNKEIEEKNTIRDVENQKGLYPFSKISVEMLLDSLKTAIISHSKYPNERIAEQLKMSTQTFFELFFGKQNNPTEVYYDILCIAKVSYLLAIIETLYRKIYFKEERLSNCSIYELLSTKLIDDTRYGWRGSIYTFPYVFLFRKHNDSDIESLTNENYVESLAYTLALAKYLIKLSLIKNKVVNQGFTDFAYALKNILSGMDQSVVFKNQKFEAYEEKETLTSVLQGPIAGDRVKKRIICILSGIFDEEKANEDFDAVLNKFYNREYRKSRGERHPFEIEHIKAYKRLSSSKYDQDLYNSIGNLVVLESSINKSIKDNEEKDKLGQSGSSEQETKGYRKSNFQSIKNIIKIIEKENEWNPDLAKQRRDTETSKIKDFLFLQ